MISRSLLVPLLLLAAPCTAAAAPPGAAALAGDAAETPPNGPGAAALAGHYRLRGGPDSVSELLLLPEGRFRFGFSAGNLDLAAEGRWTSDGRFVILNTEPRPTPPAFTAGPVSHSGGPLLIKVTDPNGRGLTSIDLRLGFADGHQVEGYTQSGGWQLSEGGDRNAARWVELSLGGYGLPPRRFPLDPAAGNEFTFILTPNDLGVQDFRDAPLTITSEGLVLSLLGGSGTYVRDNRGN